MRCPTALHWRTPFGFQPRSVHKVPATEMEALNTSLMGFFQKHKFRDLLVYISKHDFSDSKTWKGASIHRYYCRYTVSRTLVK